MLMPTIFGESLFDSFMDDFGFPNVDRISASKNTSNLMRTDIKEKEEGFELEVELPGYKKDDVKVQLKDGYLTVSASKQENNDVKDDNGKYLRRERYSGAMSRSFFVGEAVKKEDVKAKFEDGVLKLSIPKKELQALPANNTIAIEG